MYNIPKLMLLFKHRRASVEVILLLIMFFVCKLWYKRIYLGPVVDFIVFM